MAPLEWPATGLENRHGYRKVRGSNPQPSAILCGQARGPRSLISYAWQRSTRWPATNQKGRLGIGEPKAL
jgi:hypothetical protein